MIRICKSCKIEKPLTEFEKDARMLHGRTNTCKLCSCKRKLEWKHSPTGRPKSIAAKIRYNDSNARKLASRRRHLRISYDISVEEYEQMCLNQNNMCSICSSVGELVIDHNHATGVIRGLLCRQCNVSIGLLKENVNMIRNAADYLERFI